MYKNAQKITKGSVAAPKGKRVPTSRMTKSGPTTNGVNPTSRTSAQAGASTKPVSPFLNRK